MQPEFDALRPHGVTSHFARIHIPDDPVANDGDFNTLMINIRAELMVAIDRVMTCGPGAVIMGMSAETFWDGLEGSDACQQALRLCGDVKRISVITPYMPVADRNVRRFFTDCGFEVVNLVGFKCASPQLIAHVSERELRDAIRQVDDPSVEAIVQVGTNLAMARVAAIAEFWLDKPVIAINTATYWWSLRQAGITDKVFGWGSLLAEH